MQPEAAPLYDGIGPGYARHRRADDRLVRGAIALWSRARSTGTVASIGFRRIVMARRSFRSYGKTLRQAEVP